jgi:hypothetical protein
MNISSNHANINLKGVTQSTLSHSQEIAKNKMRILLTQNIWEKRLDIRLPESQLEFETLMEILCNRVKIERYVRYKNDKLATIGALEEYNKLLTTDPESKEFNELKKFLDEKGDLDTYFNKINNQFRHDEKIKKKPLKYFKELAKLEEEYLEKELITEKEIEDFYKSIIDKNINSEKKFTTKNLIKILQNKEENLKQEYQKAQLEEGLKQEYQKPQLEENLKQECQELPLKESCKVKKKQNFLSTLKNLFKKEK